MIYAIIKKQAIEVESEAHADEFLKWAEDNKLKREDDMDLFTMSGNGMAPGMLALTMQQWYNDWKWRFASDKNETTKA